MRDQRGIPINVKDAILDVRNGLEYEIIDTEVRHTPDGPRLFLVLKTNFVFPMQSEKDIERVALTGFIKVPRLDDAEHADNILKMVAGGRKQ